MKKPEDVAQKYAGQKNGKKEFKAYVIRYNSWKDKLVQAAQKRKRDSKGSFKMNISGTSNVKRPKIVKKLHTYTQKITLQRTPITVPIPEIKVKAIVREHEITNGKERIFVTYNNNKLTIRNYGGDNVFRFQQSDRTLIKTIAELLLKASEYEPEKQ